MDPANPLSRLQRENADFAATKQLKLLATSILQNLIRVLQNIDISVDLDAENWGCNYYTSEMGGSSAYNPLSRELENTQLCCKLGAAAWHKVWCSSSWSQLQIINSLKKQPNKSTGTLKPCLLHDLLDLLHSITSHIPVQTLDIIPKDFYHHSQLVTRDSKTDFQRQ